MSFTEYLKQKGLNILSLSRLTGIPYATLHKGIEQPGSLKADNLSRLSSQLSLPMGEVFDMLTGDQPAGLLHATLTEQISNKTGLYAYTQIQMTYHSGMLENYDIDLKTTQDIFKNESISGTFKVNNIVYTSASFKAFDEILRKASSILSLDMIERLFIMLTATPQQIDRKSLQQILSKYNSVQRVTFSDIIKLHVDMARATTCGILARIISFKECLAHNIIPFIIDSDYKEFYKRGIDKFDSDSTYLSDICLTMQENYLEEIKEHEGEDFVLQLKN